ncbi:MAG: CRTAC1 family protein [Planctomycetes bacterium]|nr:CRTAC1 family protein [Planctomycetota bacterium]MCB9905002.1 CRTAC1 family protein [Planctomycetota bacterium]
MRRLSPIVACFALTACSEGTHERIDLGVERSATTGEPWFEDVTRASGVDFVHVRAHTQRMWLPEIMSSGLALFDANGDGLLDLFCVQGGDLLDPQVGDTGRLYLNRGDGRFEDATREAGFTLTDYGMGCATGDYDGDGDLDLYVTNVGPNALYRNDGAGRFTDVTEVAGVGDGGWGTSTAFIDYDADGDLDLFVANYVVWSPDLVVPCTASYGKRVYCSPKAHNPARDVLYRNEGDGTFTDVTSAAGLNTAYGNGLGVAWGDLDDDGDVDIYVANDGMANQLWRNEGDGTFTDVAMESGCALNRDGKAEAGMGVAALDLSGDGKLDLFMTHFAEESNTLYENLGGRFADRTHRSGMATASLEHTGFGMGFADFDQDGNLDLFVANGRVTRRDTGPDGEAQWAEPDQLFRGLGGARFEEVAPKSGLANAPKLVSRGAAFGDVDGDGDVDVVVLDNNSGIRILANRASTKGHGITLRLVGPTGGDALGAMATITAGDKTWSQRAMTAYSYCSANDPRVHVGLGAATRVDAVHVRWPDGGTESFGPFDADTQQTLVRGAGRSAD